MMKKINKFVISIIVFIITNLTVVCFADVIMPGQDPRSHGLRPVPPQPEPSNLLTLYIIGIAILIIVAVIGTIIAKSNKSNDNADNNTESNNDENKGE